MNYNFKYKAHFDRKTLRAKANNLASKLLFSLYRNWLFKKLKLDRNSFLKSHIIFGEKRNVPRLMKSTIPDDPNLKIYSISLLDCIENEDSGQLRNRLIKVVSKYKGGFLSEEPSKKLKKAFDKFDSAYKTTSWGNIFFNDTKDNDELDLIDGISYSYVKGAQSHFVLNYTLYPSKKFNSLLKESFKAEISEESVIVFKSLKQMFKTKRLFSSISYNVKQPNYWTEKLLKEISFQAKTHIIKEVKLGIFNRKNDLLFPRIVTFEYDPVEFTSYSDEFLNVLGVNRQDHYKASDIIFTLNNSDYSKSFPNSMELFFPYKSEEEKRKDQFNNVSYLSDNFISAIAPFWLLINISSLNKQKIIDLRKKTFLYIRKNRVTIFLKKAIKLKNRLSLNWISFERIRKDFSTGIFKSQLRFYGIPDALNAPLVAGTKPQEFKEALTNYCSYTSTDIKKSFEEILELFKHNSEDNTIRANMRLQRLLFVIAMLGIILAIYGANSSWFNSWIEYYLNSWEIEIPKVPTN
jgi:hypothetical protein